MPLAFDLPATAIPLVLAAALLASWLRAAWRLRRGDAGDRPAAWRIALLGLLQCAAAVLLALVLQPPQRPVAAGTLVVLTAAHADAGVDPRDLGTTVVALPEAGAPAGVERVPDLGTARRRYPALARLHVVGDGLVARDRVATDGAALAFSPSPPPRGLVEAWSPRRGDAGATATIAGRVAGIDRATVELRDPAHHRVARATVGADGRFALAAPLRDAGRAEFRLLLRDGEGRLVESSTRGIDVGSGGGTRLQLLAAAPGAETKFLRRWAADAGLALRARVALGGGIAVGDAVATDAAALAGTDLLLLDARSWQALGDGGRARVLAAVRDGMGLLLRIDEAPGVALRRQFVALGLPFEAAGAGAGTTRLADARGTVLTHRARMAAGGDAATLLADAEGAPLATWRAVGRGRIGAWALDDTFRLALAGEFDAHARLWADAIGLLARGAGDAPPRLPATIRAGERVVACGLRAGDAWRGVDGTTAPLAVDARGCASAWPQAPGWQAIVRGGHDTAFLVEGAAALPAEHRAELRDATRALVRDTGAMQAPAFAPGPRWPWFLAFLAACALLWWLERARLGRRAHPV